MAGRSRRTGGRRTRAWADLAYTLIAWGAEYPDDMPEQIAVTDLQRPTMHLRAHPRQWPRAVASKGFKLRAAGAQDPQRHAAE
jgi:hypothetical protein